MYRFRSCFFACYEIRLLLNVDKTSSFLHNVLPAERMAIEDQTNRILDQMSEEEKREQAEKIFKNMGNLCIFEIQINHLNIFLSI